jgi:hypothetical protein
VSGHGRATRSGHLALTRPARDSGATPDRLDETKYN